jgi:hypothetical protein
MEEAYLMLQTQEPKLMQSTLLFQETLQSTAQSTLTAKVSRQEMVLEQVQQLGMAVVRVMEEMVVKEILARHIQMVVLHMDLLVHLQILVLVVEREMVLMAGQAEEQ